MAIEYADTITRYGLSLATAYAVITNFSGDTTTVDYTIEIYVDNVAFLAGDVPVDSDGIRSQALSGLTLTSGFLHGLYLNMLTQTRYSSGTIV